MNTTNRLGRPRIILWIGSLFEQDAALLEDLHRLPLVAVYSESTDTSIGDGLIQVPSLTGRYPMALTTAEETDSWNPATLPIFYLRGRRHDQTSTPLRDRHRRAAMMERFTVLADEYRPSVIAVGIAGQSEMAELLSVAAEYGSFTPVVIGGDEAQLHELLALVRENSVGPLVEPTIVAGEWTDIRQHLANAGISLLIDEDDLPALLLGKTPVPLATVFADPETRIDHTWRMITVKALRQSPPPVAYESLFDAAMRLDEGADARTVEDDYKEWWAIGDGFLAERADLRTSINQVLAALQGEVLRSSKVLWVAAEAGSGATMFLHSIAYRTALAGFPTLIAKQHARNPLSRQLTDFLTRLHDEARRTGGSGHTDMPALIVLDVPHELSGAMEDLSERVQEVSGRRIITLRAVRIEPGVASPSPTQDRVHWLSQLLADDDTARRMPRKGDGVIAILKSRPSPDEIAHVDEKARWLRSARGIALFENPSDTWGAFRHRESFAVETLLKNEGLQGDELAQAKQAFQADQLFWLVLYHFLKTRGRDEREQPLLESLRRRMVTVVERAATVGLSKNLAIGTLLEAAKLSSLGVVCPMTALVDWISEQLVVDSAATASSDTASGEAMAESASRRLTSDEIGDAVRALRDWAAGDRRFDPRRSKNSPELMVSQAIDLLTREVLLRQHTINGRSYVSVPSPVLAQAILLAALNAVGDIGPSLHQSIGGIRAVLFREHALDGLSGLLSRLTVAQANIQLCQDLSERLLKGDDDSPEWARGGGERRLAAYGLIPVEIRNMSRVLSHHHALVLKRTTFANGMDDGKKLERLLLAREGLAHALTLPWNWGERSDHPAFIRTTLGIVLEQIARLIPVESERWREQARNELRSAFAEKPNSRHTRLALANHCIAEARGRVPPDTVAAGFAAECLQLLSVEPTGQFARWYATKSQAALLFGDDAGRQFIEGLCALGIEDGFLLKAELLLQKDPPEVGGALSVLSPLIKGDNAAAHGRACRRAAELMRQDDLLRFQHEERARLLRVVESRVERLTPSEEFQLAYLSFQLGDSADGRRRFTVLRATGRSSDVAAEEKPFLSDADRSEPLRCRGVVISIEGNRGWMRLEREAGETRLFDAPFVTRHFADTVRPHQQYRALIRFTENGPTAVPESFARTKSR